MQSIFFLNIASIGRKNGNSFQIFIDFIGIAVFFNFEFGTKMDD